MAKQSRKPATAPSTAPDTPASAESTADTSDGNQYDKLLKEGLRPSVIDLFTRFLGLPQGKYTPQHIEFQKTRERRTDRAIAHPVEHP